MNSKSINYWSYPGGLEGSLALPDFFRRAKAHGYDAVEVCIGADGAFSYEASESDCRTLLAKAAEEDVRIESVASGTYWGFNLASEDPADRARAKVALGKMARITGWLGCKALLTIPGAVDVFFLPDRPVQRYDLVMEAAAEGLRAVLPMAEDSGVTLAIENVWNKILLSPGEVVAFIDSFNSPFIGAYIDVANMLPFGYPEQWLRILGHRVAGVHFKDFRRSVGTGEGFVDLLEGDVNWPEVMRAIQEIGYTGPVVAELIPHFRHHPDARAAMNSVAMDFILGRRRI